MHALSVQLTYAVIVTISASAILASCQLACRLICWSAGPAAAVISGEAKLRLVVTMSPTQQSPVTTWYDVCCFWTLCRVQPRCFTSSVPRARLTPWTRPGRYSRRCVAVAARRKAPGYRPTQTECMELSRAGLLGRYLFSCLLM